MWGIKAEGEATAGVVIASANQIHECGRANEPGSARIPSFERSLPGGGIVGVHIATGNYISTSSIKGTTAIKDTAVASGNDMRGFKGRLFENVSSSSGNFPKAAAGGYSRGGVVDAANKETILAGRIGGSGGGRILALANGAEGQLVTLIAREPTTLVHGHAATAGMLGQPILTRGGGDKPLAAYESVRLVLDGGSWREVAEGCRLKSDDASGAAAPHARETGAPILATDVLVAPPSSCGTLPASCLPGQCKEQRKTMAACLAEEAGLLRNRTLPVVLGGLPTVLDFGAQANSSVDDTSSFSFALAHHPTIRVPPGKHSARSS